MGVSGGWLDAGAVDAAIWSVWERERGVRDLQFWCWPSTLWQALTLSGDMEYDYTRVKYYSTTRKGKVIIDIFNLRLLLLVINSML